MFLDHVQLHVEAGHGGAGAISFRREKFAAEGGPDGGDGGKGGSIFIRANRALNTLNPYRHKRDFAAERGRQGEGCMRHGRDGLDITLEVPLGTVVKDGERRGAGGTAGPTARSVCVARGGRGGLGNTNFKSSTNRTPRHHQPGEDGEDAQPRPGAEAHRRRGPGGLPQRRQVHPGEPRQRGPAQDRRLPLHHPGAPARRGEPGPFGGDLLDSFVIADIPGLIEGAAGGAGLGIQFLRHVERTRMLLHLVDLSDPITSPPRPSASSKASCWPSAPVLAAKPRWLVGTKLDALQDEERRAALRSHLPPTGGRSPSSSRASPARASASWPSRWTMP